MKKTLRLTELSKKELSQRQMRNLKAGERVRDWCTEKCGTKSPDIDFAGGQWYEYFYD